MPTTLIRALVFDDSGGLALPDGNQYRFEVCTEPTTDSALDRLVNADPPIDCAVGSPAVVETDGLGFLETIREDHPSLPIVVCLDPSQHSIAEAAIARGATDCHLQDGTDDRTVLLANRVRNVVERYRSQRELDRRDHRLETLIDNLPGVVYRCRNEPGWPMECIEGDCEEITGHTSEAFERGAVSLGTDLIHPDDRAVVRQTVQDGLDARGSYEVTYRLVTPSGMTKWVWERGWGIEDGNGDIEALEGFITDITEQTQREDELRQNQRRFEAVFEDPKMLVGMLDLDGTLLHVNGTALAFVDVALEDVTGKPFWETPWWSDDVRNSVQQWVERAAGGEYVGYETDLEQPNGETLRLSGTIRPVTDDTGAPTSLIVSARDITEQRNRYHDLEQTRDRLAVLNQVVRHDLRNDMQVVRGRARLLADHVDDEGMDHLEEVLLSAEEAIDLTTTARTLTETILGTGDETRSVSVRHTVSSAVDTARSRHEQAAITVYGMGTNVTILADDMFESVIHNLLQNAVVHNDTDLPEVEVSIERANGSVLLSVADNGPGIPDDRKNDVFGRGEKGLESPGTGIGLYLVRTLVEGYGGDVWIDDNEPRGSIFRVRLPVEEEVTP